MRVSEILDIATKAGEILLCSGAEIYRVEDTIVRICKSYNIYCEAFVMPNGIFVSVIGSDNETTTRVMRLKERNVDLNRVELVNSFSRNIQKEQLDYEEALAHLESIKNSKRYNFYLRLLASAMISFIYTILFNGNYIEGIIAFFIGAVIYIVKEEISKIGFFQFFDIFISGAIAGLMSILASKIILEIDIYKIIIGSIMILLPGVAITNAIKDALYGDIVSSIFRISEAVFIAVAVGIGVGIVISISIYLK